VKYKLENDCNIHVSNGQGKVLINNQTLLLDGSRYELSDLGDCYLVKERQLSGGMFPNDWYWYTLISKDLSRRSSSLSSLTDVMREVLSKDNSQYYPARALNCMLNEQPSSFEDYYKACRGNESSIIKHIDGNYYLFC
jgi:hypothetical protein